MIIFSGNIDVYRFVSFRSMYNLEMRLADIFICIVLEVKIVIFEISV